MCLYKPVDLMLYPRHRLLSTCFAGFVQGYNFQLPLTLKSAFIEVAWGSSKFHRRVQNSAGWLYSVPFFVEQYSIRNMSIRKYHIGCTVWSLKEWKGFFYTDDARPDDFLRQYASVFNSVEGNTTFYNIPKPATLKKWDEQTPDGFKFCFKFHRSITHYKQLDGTGDDILNFLDRFESITNRLGPFMIQLPPQFSPEHMGRLEATLAILPGNYSYAVEVRHPDFYDRGKKEHQLNRLLESYNIDRIIFDTRKLHSIKTDDPSIKEAQQKKPKVPVRFTTTGSRPFVRFVGANDVLNNEAYLKEWAIIIADWIKTGLHPYIFTHAPDKVSQPPIARRFHQILSELIEMNPMPAWPVEGQDEQLNLF